MTEVNLRGERKGKNRTELSGAEQRTAKQKRASEQKGGSQLGHEKIKRQVSKNHFNKVQDPKGCGVGRGSQHRQNWQQLTKEARIVFRADI